jgi:hypothetical protein
MENNQLDHQNTQLQRELEHTQRLLACFIFENTYNFLSEQITPITVVNRLQALANQAPPSVLALVEYLTHHMPEEQTLSDEEMEEHTHIYTFPFFQC